MTTEATMLPMMFAEAAGQLLIDFAPLVTKQISLPADEPRAKAGV